MAVPSYSGPGGSGDRRNDIKLSLSGPSPNGRPSQLVNGVTGSTDSFFWSGFATNTILTFDFGPGHARVITEFRWTQSSATSQGTYDFEASNDATSWDTLITGLVLGATNAVNTYSCASNTTEYRYYRLRQTAGNTSSSPFLREIEFKIAGGASELTSATNVLAKGDRRSRITMSSTFTLGDVSAPLNNLIDGEFGSSTATATWFATGQTNKVIVFDMGEDVIVDKMAWISSNSTDDGTYSFEGSLDGVSYTTLVSSFNIINTDTLIQFANTTAYRYYRISGPSAGTMSNRWQHEVEFSVSQIAGEGGSATVSTRKTVVCVASSGD